MSEILQLGPEALQVAEGAGYLLWRKGLGSPWILEELVQAGGKGKAHSVKGACAARSR